jgi:hypothetical protein
MPSSEIRFDPDLHLSPYTLFRRLLSCRGWPEKETPLLVDLRQGAEGPRLAGSRPWPGPGWEPPADRDVVLVDQAGKQALEAVRRLRGEGHARVWALYGGVALYDFALDPAVVGDERFLA